MQRGDDEAQKSLEKEIDTLQVERHETFKELHPEMRDEAANESHDVTGATPAAFPNRVPGCSRGLRVPRGQM
jgi:hypothetical protein